MVIQFHGNFSSKTLGCMKIKYVFRDVKWCFNALWELQGLKKHLVSTLQSSTSIHLSCLSVPHFLFSLCKLCWHSLNLLSSLTHSSCYNDFFPKIWHEASTHYLHGIIFQHIFNYCELWKWEKKIFKNQPFQRVTELSDVYNLMLFWCWGSIVHIDPVSKQHLAIDVRVQSWHLKSIPILKELKNYTQSHNDRQSYPCWLLFRQLLMLLS